MTERDPWKDLELCEWPEPGTSVVEWVERITAKLREYITETLRLRAENERLKKEAGDGFKALLDNHALRTRLATLEEALEANCSVCPYRPEPESKPNFSTCAHRPCVIVEALHGGKEDGQGE